MNNNANIRLFKAIEQKDIEGVVLALSDGADVNAMNEKGTSPLLYALEQLDVFGTSSTKRSANANANEQITEIALMLIEKADLNYARQSDGITALHCLSDNAGWSGMPRLIHSLLDAGANINAKDKLGRTPLIAFASQSASYNEFMSLLMSLEEENAIDMNAQDNEGRTALMWLLANQGLHELKAERSKGKELFRENRIISTYNAIVELFETFDLDKTIKSKAGYVAEDIRKNPSLLGDEIITEEYNTVIDPPNNITRAL